MIYTKDEFKKLWESDEHGGGITNDDVADCAKAWRVCSSPRTRKLDTVLYMVCKAAGVNEDELPYNPNEDKKNDKEEKKKTTKKKLTADDAWRAYNFVTEYKAGVFGLISLQEAIDKHYRNYLKQRL